MAAWKSEPVSGNYLCRFCTDDYEEQCGYVNSSGDTIVPAGRYKLCITDTIKTFGTVIDAENRFIAIDIKGDYLFEVFNYDNGPDYFSEGTFRIIKDGKIGYADSTGNIIIEPQFSCAFPFMNGKAKVSYHCEETTEREYKVWNSDDWFYVDKHGNRAE